MASQPLHQVPIVIFHNTTQGWEAELVGKQRSALPTSTTLSNLNRSWTIDETIISVSGTGVDASLGVAKLFKGCSPNAIAEYVDSKGLDLEIPSTDYDVTQFSFDDTGKFTLYFSKHDPICGDFDLQSNKLSYDFNAPSNDNPLLAVSASGEFSVVDGRGRLEVDSTAKGEGHNYQLKIIFWLLPVE